MAFAESIGLPPPTEIIVSTLLSFNTKSVASSSCLMGACCPILLYVAAWCFDPNSSSTCLINGVLLASEVPVMMNAFDESLGRHSRRCFLTLSDP